jgi:hypothetical protein
VSSLLCATGDISTLRRSLLEEPSTEDAMHRAALSDKLEQLVYAANNLGLLAMR